LRVGKASTELGDAAALEGSMPNGTAVGTSFAPYKRGRSISPPLKVAKLGYTAGLCALIVLAKSAI